MAGSIIEVTDDSFQAEVMESETPILVDFWAPWCGPCRAISPLLEEIAEGREDVRIVKLNVDENQLTAAQYGILSIPTLILFNNGAEAKRLRRRATRASSNSSSSSSPLPDPSARPLTGRRVSRRGRQRSAARGPRCWRSRRRRWRRTRR